MKKISVFLVLVSLFLTACQEKTQETQHSTSQTISQTAGKETASQTEVADHLVSDQLTTDEGKKYIQQAFYNWAIKEGNKRNQAVSDWYFAHGAAGLGDWFANTSDGQMQMREGKLPGKAAFDLHCIGGVVFYTALDGTIGKDELNRGSFADNYKLNMDMSKPVSKYLLGDNGVVYELKTGNGTEVTTATGFSQYDDEGKNVVEDPPTFTVSEDEAAQKALKKIIAEYQNV